MSKPLTIIKLYKEICLSQIRINYHTEKIEIYELMMIDSEDRNELLSLKSDSKMMINLYQSYIHETIDKILKKEDGP